MKKSAAILLTVLLGGAILAGCGSSENEENPPLTVYSFSGENEQLEISNGVIVLNGEEDVFYGGNLKDKQEKLSDLSAVKMTFYIVAEDGKNTIMSNAVVDKTGNTVAIEGENGKSSGDIFRERDRDAIAKNLYFELETTDRSGKENSYQLQLTATEITDFKNNK